LPFCILAVNAGLVVGPLIGFALCAAADLSFHCVIRSPDAGLVGWN